MAIQIRDNSGDTNGLAVNVNKQVEVHNPTDETQSGFVALSAESHAGAEGMPRRNRSLEVSADYRLRTGSDAYLFRDVFNHSQPNTSKYRITNTTMANAMTGGKWVFNSGLSTASGVGTIGQTHAFFTLGLTGSMYIDFEAAILIAPQANNVCEFGLYQCSGVTPPVDGAYIRLNAAGVWEACVNNNSAETAMQMIATNGSAYTAGVSVMRHYKIGLHNDITDFWVDDLLYASIPTPPTVGSPSLSMSSPLTMRVYNSGIVSMAQQLLVSNVSVSSGDLDTLRSWNIVNAVMGNHCMNAPDGQSAGSTGSYILSTAPVSITAASQLSSVAAYTTLGGRFNLASIASSETDLCIYSYLNPLGTPAIPGKNLLITNIAIDALNTGVIGSAVTLIQEWAVCPDSTASGLSVVDSATAGTKAGRKLAMGFVVIPANAAVGAQATRSIDKDFDPPLVVNPGNYMNIFMRSISGPVNTGQITRGFCAVQGYNE